MFNNKLTESVKHLIIINVIVFIACSIDSLSFLQRDLALWGPEHDSFKPWQILTHIFMHGNFRHLLFNMIGLFFIGPLLERSYGQKVFLQIYFVSALIGALLEITINHFALGYIPPMVGASAAISGIFGALVRSYPNMEVLLYFILPLKMKYAFYGTVAFSVYGAFTNYMEPGSDNVAHMAHLGGLFAGYLLMDYTIKNKFRKQ